MMSGHMTAEDIEKTYNVIMKSNGNLIDYSYSVMWTTKVIVISSWADYPWIRSIDHLRRVNKYRKRVGQWQLVFNDDDMADLILLGDG